MMNLYILASDGRTPIAQDDMVAWAMWWGTADRRVAKDVIEGLCEVSTVFLGIDQRFGGDGPPLLYETMVFYELGDGDNENCWRFSTHDAALAWHQRLVAHLNDVKANSKPAMVAALCKAFGEELLARRASEQGEDEMNGDAWQDVLREADQIVRGKPTWSRFIKGTPLENDVPVWMADFMLLGRTRERAKDASDAKMPELPDGETAIWSEYERADGVAVIVRRDFTSEQMQEYGRACMVAAAQADNASLLAAFNNFDSLVRQWASAYPESVFPEPDMAQAHAALQKDGMALDSVSASNMRYVITRIDAELQTLRAAFRERFDANST